MPDSLSGLRILVPESRELDLFAGMLEAQGAQTLRCPLVAILDLLDTSPAEAWLRRLISGGFDDLILLTGEGLRRLLAIAENVGIDRDAVAALGRIRTIVRGPKPARVLREIGLSAGLSAATPTTEGVIETLSAIDLTGRRIGVQLYPGNTNDLLLNFLRSAGATPDAILPYRYASNTETAKVEEAIRQLADGNIDVVAFTSTPQVQRLEDVARERGMIDLLTAGLARTRIAAVGPVVAAAAERIGAKVDVLPETSFHMKPLVNAIVAALGRQTV